jgi:3'-5' exoribonuclease
MSDQVSLTEQPALAPAGEPAANGGASANGAVQVDPANGTDSGAEGERLWVRDLADGQPVEGVFGVRERELRQRRNGGDWLRLVICDRSGCVEAVAWDGVTDFFEIADPGTAVHITGRFAIHSQYGPKITIESIRAAADGEFEAADLAEGPSVPVEHLEAELRELLATIQNPQLAALLDRFFAPDSRVWHRFRDAPAAKYYHQAYRHGLLDHTVSVAQAVSASASAFPGIDRDIAIAGALLHDIGKTMAYNDDPLAIDLTDAGRLQGEIPLGYYLVRREVERIDGFDAELAQALFHIVLSHHGALENGSPVIPATREATLVHSMDNLGGKLGSFDRIERALPDGETWSRFDRGLDSAAYFRSRAA